MKKLNFFFSLILLLMGGVISADATKKYADLTKLDANLGWQTNSTNGCWGTLNGETWEPTHVYEWKAGYSCLIELTDLKGDLSEFTHINFDTQDMDPASGESWRCVINANGKEKTVSFSSAGQFSKSLKDDFGFTVEDLKNVTQVRIGGHYGTTSIGKIKFNSICLVSPTKVAFNDSGVCAFDFSDVVCTGTVSFNETTGELISTGTNGHLKINFDKAYDLSALKRWQIECTGASVFGNGWQLVGVTKKSDSSVLGMYSGYTDRNFGAGQTINPTDYDMTAVTGIDIPVTKEGTMTISSLKLTANVLAASKMVIEDAAIDAPWYKYDIASSLYRLDNTHAGCDNNVNTTAGNFYGRGSNGEDLGNYADLSGYSAIRVYTASDKTPRAFFFDPTRAPIVEDGVLKTQGWNQVGYTAHLQSTSWNVDFVRNNEGGYFELDLNALAAKGAPMKLTCVRAASGQSYAAEVKFVGKETNYAMTGSGMMSASATEALSDENATFIDATGVTGTGVELVSVNPNCMFKANAGVLANTTNVMVDGVINNLAITDGKPFAMPAEATGATSASYTREFTVAYSTVCLPFSATFTGSAYEYSESDGSSVTFTEVEGNTLEAGKAYLVKAGFAVTGGSGVALAPVNADFQGTFSSVAAPAGAYGFSTAGVFVKVGTGVTCPAFRAYLKESAGAGMKTMKVVFEGGNATAAEATTAEGADEIVAIYSINGVQQQELKAGVNIVKLANGETKTFVIK